MYDRRSGASDGRGTRRKLAIGTRWLGPGMEAVVLAILSAIVFCAVSYCHCRHCRGAVAPPNRHHQAVSHGEVRTTAL